MTAGKVSKLVTSFGSTWGRIKPDGEEREIFFSPATLLDPTGYNDILVGQEVEYEEEPDRANGSHAVRVRMTPAEVTAS